MLGGTAKCAFCGKEFVKKTVNQIYCSKFCYVESTRITAREWQRRKKNVSKVFTTDGIGCLDYTPKYEYDTAPTQKATADYVNTGDDFIRQFIGKVVKII